MRKIYDLTILRFDDLTIYDLRFDDFTILGLLLQCAVPRHRWQHSPRMLVL